MSAPRHSVRRAVERWGIAVLALIAWQLATARAQSVYFPEPAKILQRIQELWLNADAAHLFVNGDFLSRLLSSLSRLFLGWGTAVVVGVAAGVALGLWRRAEEYANPTLQFLRSLPVPALIPLFLVVFGTGFQMRLSLVVFAVVWPILLNTIEGVRSIEPQLLRTGAVFRVPRSRQILLVVIPAASPKIFAGMRISLSIALIVTILSEMVASTDGVGMGLIDAQRTFAMPDMWAYIVLFAVLGVTLNGLLMAVENRALAWHLGARRRDGGS
ncbi:ABC transporter permease [Streptomyces sp. NPDC096311]|uniref:ABC transporter permease n=1 Tax=Streptomyces sp. NPDC096311 TaxID=3366083 RepID=UPI00382F79B0